MHVLLIDLIQIYLYKDKIVSQVKLNIPTYTEDNIPENLSAMKAVKPGSRNL